jgi:DegV family protein with EDD domain
MDSTYKIITDATSDLCVELYEPSSIEVIPMPVTLDGHEFNHYADYREMPLKDFYNALRDGKTSSTAQINTYTYTKFFEPYLKDGLDIIYLCFSSALSSTIQSAGIAIEELKLKYPDRKIICIDTLCASTGLGYLVYHALQKQIQGYSLERLTEWVESKKLHVCHWFTVEDLNHLYRGGRLSKTAAVAGTMFKIKPILIVDKSGSLIVVDKVRGSNKARHTMINHMKESGINLEDHTIFIGHGDDLDSAEKLKEMVQSEVKVKNIFIMPIGPVVGTHTGPGMLSIFFFGNER